MGQIITQTARVGESDAGKRQAFLLLEVRDLFGCTVTQRVRFTRGEAGIKQSRHVVRLHGSVRHACARDLHLDQGLEPQEAA